MWSVGNRCPMCVNKLYVKNNKLDFLPLVDRLYNYVPCGRCEECLRLRSLEYEIRNVAEFEHNKKLGNTTHFYTLTYAPEHLPTYLGHGCFSKRDIQLFFKRFRKNLKSLGYATDFKYFLSSEYGHERTDNYRPHYHFILYMPFSIRPERLSRLIKDSWQLGFIQPGSLNNGLIVNTNPLRYVCKYLSKDMAVVKYLDTRDYSKDDLVYSKRMGFDILPFHMQSRGLGSSLLDSLTDTDFINGYFMKTDSRGLSKKYPIPQYLRKKALFKTYVNDNGNISYLLNDRGKRLFVPMLQKQISKLAEHFRSVFKFADWHIMPELRKFFVGDRGSFEHYQCVMFNEYAEQLAMYYCVYRGHENIPFQYRSISEDLSIYCDVLSLPQVLKRPSFVNEFTLFHEPKEYINSAFDEGLINLIDVISRYKSYSDYLDNVNKYNVRQTQLFYKTKKFKPITPKCFEDFNDIRLNSKCLSILNSNHYV